MTRPETCTCYYGPDHDGPEIDCPVHGKYPHIKVKIVEGEGLLLDFSAHIRAMGLKDGDEVYVTLLTQHPLDEEISHRPEPLAYPRQDGPLGWAATSYVAAVIGIEASPGFGIAALNDAVYVDEDEEDEG